MCVCVSAIEIQTTGAISIKFGMGMLLNMGKIHCWVATPYPYPQGQGGPKQGVACLYSLNHLTW